MNKKEDNEIHDISVEDIIKEVEDNTETFLSDTGEAFIKTKSNNNISPIDSEEFECWLREFCYENFNMRVLYPATVLQVKGHLKMLSNKSKKRKLHRRIYDKKDSVYYDLGLDGSRYLKITNDDVKKVKNTSLLMMRSNVFCSQVEPDLEASPEEILYFVDKHFHFSSDAEKLLFSVFLVASFFAETMPMPIIQLYGEKASGKTLCEKRILDLLNPVSTGICTLPKSSRDLKVCLASDYIHAFDNVGWINDEVSNLLCNVCTGGTVPSRKLYTDNGQVYVKIQAIVIFNSVNQCVTKSDLADRILTFHLDRFNQGERKGEKELERAWKQDKPRFFGAICNAVKGVLGDRKIPKKKSPFRLVDFYNLAVKIGRMLEVTEGDVYNAFKENQYIINDAIVSGDIVLSTVEQYMAQYEENVTWSFTPTNLYKELKDFAHDELGIGRGFPGSAATLSRKLGECKSNLEDIGIYFETGRSSERYIEIWKVKN